MPKINVSFAPSGGAYQNKRYSREYLLSLCENNEEDKAPFITDGDIERLEKKYFTYHFNQDERYCLHDTAEETSMIISEIDQLGTASAISSPQLIDEVQQGQCTPQMQDDDELREEKKPEIDQHTPQMQDDDGLREEQQPEIDQHTPQMLDDDDLNKYLDKYFEALKESMVQYDEEEQTKMNQNQQNQTNVNQNEQNTSINKLRLNQNSMNQTRQDTSSMNERILKMTSFGDKLNQREEKQNTMNQNQQNQTNVNQNEQNTSTNKLRQNQNSMNQARQDTISMNKPLQDQNSMNQGRQDTTSMNKPLQDQNSMNQNQQTLEEFSHSYNGVEEMKSQLHNIEKDEQILPKLIRDINNYQDYIEDQRESARKIAQDAIENLYERSNPTLDRKLESIGEGFLFKKQMRKVHSLGIRRIINFLDAKKYLPLER